MHMLTLIKGHHVISVNTISVLLPWAILPCHILPKPPPCPGGMRWCPACTSSGSLSPWCLRGLTAWGTSSSCLQGAKDFFSSNCYLNICVGYAGSPRFITFAWMCPPTLSSMNILDRSLFISSWLINPALREYLNMAKCIMDPRHWVSKLY